MTEGKSWVRIARCHDIPPREGRAVRVGNREIAIFNLEGRFLAIENRCPHKGGPLADGIVSGDSVVCPLHAWKLSLETGRGLNSPSASSCVETFRTRVEDGVILVELNGSQMAQEAGVEGLPMLCVDPSSLSASEESSSAP